MELNIEKDRWGRMKLLDVFTKKEENDKENAHNRFDRFLKVEHLDKESLHIKRWCSQENGDEVNPTFYKIFRKGQILFPTRNPHLRRTALASFDGICGEKTLTLEPNEEYLVPEFIPFLFHSESFYAHTTSAIVGSTNPHVRWRDVANYEFLLPPKDQQAQLAELLWAMDEVVALNIKTLESLDNLYRSNREYVILMEGISSSLVYNSRLKEKVNEQLQFMRLTEALTDIRYGTSKKGNSDNKGVPVLGIPNVVQEKLSLDKINYADLEGKELESCRLACGDIVIVRTNGNPEYTGKSALYNIDRGHAFASYLIKITVDNKIIDPEFLVRFLQTRTARRYFKRHATSTAGNYNINTETIKGIVIPFHTKKRQQEIVTKLKAIEQNLNQSMNYMLSSKALQKSLINQIF